MPNRWLGVFLCLLLALMACSQAILATMSKNKYGTYDYNTSSAALVAEAAKLLLSSILIIKESYLHSLSIDCILKVETLSFWYIVLGLVYAVQNNVLFYAMKYIDPGTFQILINLKLPLIAFLLHALQGRLYSNQQKLGLGFLTIGAMLSRVDPKNMSIRDSEFWGYALVIIMVSTGATASVLNELLLKNEKNGSLNWQNFQLYLWGTVFCSLNMIANVKESFSFPHLFDGFNAYAYLSVLNLSSLGLTTSFLLKYSNNIVRSISGILSIYLSLSFSALFLHITVSPIALIGFLAAGVGILLYCEIFSIEGP